MVKEMLYLLVVLALTLQGGYVHGQTCDETFSMQDPIGLDTSLDTSCITCSNYDGPQANPNWSVIGGSLDGATVDGGTLRITDAVIFLGGEIVPLRCGLLIQFVTAAGFFAPTASTTNNGVVIEGGDISPTCSHINVPSTVSLEWLSPTGQVVATIGTLRLTDVQRSEAGVYTCRLTEISTDKTLSDTTNITVHYPPNIVSDDPATILVFITGRISLSCTYDSVTSSIVEWFQNGEQLTNGQDGVIFNTDTVNRVSILARNGLDLNSGGIYTCRATNMIGVAPNEIEASANATTEVIIQVCSSNPPPASRVTLSDTPPSPALLGSTLSFTCNGQTVSATCESDGQWSPNPSTYQCLYIPANCTVPEEPSGGTIVYMVDGVIVNYERLNETVEETTVLTYQCDCGLSLTGPNTITCTNAGVWSTDSRESVCVQTANYTPTAAPLSTGVTVTISVVITFIVTLVIGFITGFITSTLCSRKKAVYSPTAEGYANVGPTTPAGPVYEEVSPKEEIELNTNEAYQPVRL